MKHLWLGLVFLMLLLAACAGGVSDAPAGGTPVADSDRERSPSVQPTPPLSVLPTSSLPNVMEDAAITTLRQLVAEQVQIAPAELTLVSTEEVVWPDASLGCPQAGKMYAQVLTPGWRTVFTDTAGHTYNVHMPENPKLFVICTPTAVRPTATAQDNPAVEAAIQVLIEQVGVTRESVAVLTVEAVEWANSCLGCARPGEQCLMVITPGYRIVLTSGGNTYTLHTNRSGGHAILCDRPDNPLPRSDS
ncbi:MAG TPA: hypothetical protein PLH19_10435 [Anaerolineae bacterium]|nr:hypothetical protein [Anaerolineae bacterium]HQH38934.1 hypothetical protein [Anaerolineae bacterium]